MKKLCLILTLCLLAFCFAACKDEAPAKDTGTNPVTTVTADTGATEAPTEEEEETKAPETPLYDWTARY